MPKGFKISGGRRECMLCPEPTISEPVVLVYDPSNPPGSQVQRAHLTCLLNSPERIKEMIPSKHPSGIDKESFNVVK